jgi:cysteinyl-tRNA synthetase
MTEVDYIMNLIEEGKAYTINMDIGEFVCARFEKFPNLKVSPVQYPILKGNKYREDDFPIWGPYKDGNISPFGNGQPTVNLYILKSII